MNYRHAFHAGNFADVFKHVFLVRLLSYLALKESAFRVIDTHAGEGAYDLASTEAARTGEWRGGVGRLAALREDDPAWPLIAPWLALLGPRDAQGRPALYPGSPLIAQKLMRPQDRALFCEKHEATFAALRKRFARDRRIKTLALDGWSGLNAFLPPPERRGLVLIDPPFEATDELDRLGAAFAQAFRKWPTGVYALWFPVKAARTSEKLTAALRAAGATRLLTLECAVAPMSADGLTSNGLALVNPPFTLAGEAERILPTLVRLMERAPGAGAFRMIA